MIVVDAIFVFKMGFCSKTSDPYAQKGDLDPDPMSQNGSNLVNPWIELTFKSYKSELKPVNTIYDFATKICIANCNIFKLEI